MYTFIFIKSNILSNCAFIEDEKKTSWDISDGIVVNTLAIGYFRPLIEYFILLQLSDIKVIMHFRNYF